MSDKIKLAPRQQQAEYFFQAVDLCELGADLDLFYRSIDFDAAGPSSSISIDMPFHVVRSWQNGVERVSIGNYYATETIYRRGTAE